MYLHLNRDLYMQHERAECKLKTTFMILNPRLEAVQWNIWSLQIQQGQYMLPVIKEYCVLMSIQGSN